MTAKVSVILPLYVTSQNVEKALDCLNAQTVQDWELIIFDERWQTKDYGKALSEKVAGHEKVSVFVQAHRNAAALLNSGIDKAMGDYIVILPPDVYYEKDLLEKYIAKFEADKKVARVYSSYKTLKKDGSIQEDKLYPYLGQVEEGVEFGFVKMYDKAKVIEKGYFCEDYDYAEEYDMRLKLTDDYSIEFCEECLYLADMSAEVKDEEASFTKLCSPGSGGQGSFSYLLYTREQEREFEIAAKEMLKRRGAFLTKRNDIVEYGPDEKFDVMVTVVIPILNRKCFIKNTLMKVIEGTFESFEILVVDNGSTDGTQQEVLSVNDERVKLVQHDGKCIADALNKGIELARGKYVAQLDSDDEYAEDTLEAMVAHMESHPRCGLAVSYYNLIDEDGTVLEELPIVKHLEFDRNNLIRVGGAGALRFFHKKVLVEMGYYDAVNFGNFAEDYDMVNKISAKYDVDRVHKVLYKYRRHEDNTDVTRDPFMKIENKAKIRLNSIRRRQELVKKGIR